MTASRLRLTESALQGRLYSVSVSAVDYSYPRKLFISCILGKCLTPSDDLRLFSDLLLSNGRPSIVDNVSLGNVFS
jgi:hypothetical protein